jgi:hypothetical protein
MKPSAVSANMFFTVVFLASAADVDDAPGSLKERANFGFEFLMVLYLSLSEPAYASFFSFLAPGFSMGVCPLSLR